MDVDIAPARAPFGEPCVVAVPHASPSVVAVMDGGGSWGSGTEAAAWVRSRIAEEWQGAHPASLGRAAAMINRAAAAVPAALAGPGFDAEDHSFSVAAIAIAEDGVYLTSAGTYGVVGVSNNVAASLRAPGSWVQQQVSEGRLTMQDAAVHPLRHVCIGPFVSATEQGSLAIQGPFDQSLVFVLACQTLFLHLLTTPVASWLHLRAQDLQGLSDHANAGYRAVVVVRPGRSA